MKFSLDTFRAALEPMLPCNSVLIGLSGGLDSVVMLHALVHLRAAGELPFNLRAMHVHHGLNPAATAWQQHCATLCQQWEVPLVSTHLNLSEFVQAGTGIENAARTARYAAFSAQLGTAEVLLLAQHRDDQMETLLLRLMRGAGPRGLGGMPRSRSLGAGMLFRPLLQFDRSELLGYAHHQQLQWVDDDSNAAQQFDRNYCRHTLLPLIEARWPQYRASWSKSIALQSEADVLLQELAEADLQQLRVIQDKTLQATSAHDLRNALPLEALLSLSLPRQRNLVRRWFVQLGLPEPGWNELQQLVTEVMPTVRDSKASYSGAGYSVVRYKNQLLVLRALNPIDRHAAMTWSPGQQPDFVLPDNGYLVARPSNNDRQDQQLAVTVTGTLQVRYRQGGETCRLRGRPDKSLKKLLQEQGIAPWYRERLPLIYAGDELICVPGIGATDGNRATAASTSTTPHIVIEWQPPDWMPGA